MKVYAVTTTNLSTEPSEHCLTREEANRRCAKRQEKLDQEFNRRRFDAAAISKSWLKTFDQRNPRADVAMVVEINVDEV